MFPDFRKCASWKNKEKYSSIFLTRCWFSGRMPAFQAGDKSSILLRRTKMKKLQVHPWSFFIFLRRISQWLGLSENRIRAVYRCRPLPSRSRKTASSNARQFCDRFSYAAPLLYATLFYMKFPSTGPIGEPQAPVKKESSLDAREERQKAIAKLQKDLREKNDVDPLLRAARIKALVTLLSKEFEDEHGVLVTPDMMHYSDYESASNESNLEGDKKFG